MRNKTLGVSSGAKYLMGLSLLASSLAVATDVVSAEPLPIEYSDCKAWGDYYVQVYVGASGTDPVFESVDYASSESSIVIRFETLSGVNPRDVYIEPWLYSDPDCTISVLLTISACVTPVRAAVDDYPDEPYPFGFETSMENEVSGADPSVQLTWETNTDSGASIYPDYDSFLYGGNGGNPIVPVSQVLEGWLVITLLNADQIADLEDNDVASTVASELCEADLGRGNGGSWSGPDIDLDHYRRRAEQMVLPDTL